MTVLLQTALPPRCIRDSTALNILITLYDTRPCYRKRTWDLNQTHIKASALSSPCNDCDLGLIRKPVSLGDKAKALSVTYE